MDSSKVYLTDVEMTNCQSHEKTVMSFSTNTVNAIIGQNSAGKSVLFKMIIATVCPNTYDKTDRENLIRHGADFAQIMYAFSDGVYGCTRIFPTGIVQGIMYPGENKFQTSLEPIEDLVDRLGILADSNEKFIANILDPKNSQLLVDSDMRSNENLLKLITENEVLNKLATEVDEKISKTVDNQERVSMKLDSVMSILNELTYVDAKALENSIEKAELFSKCTYSFVDVYDLVQNVETLVSDRRDFDTLIRLCEVFERILEFNQLLQKFSIPKEVDTNLIVAADKLVPVYEGLKSIKVPHQICDVSKALSLTDSILLLNSIAQQLNRISISGAIDYSKVISMAEILIECIELNKLLEKLGKTVKNRENSLVSIEKAKHDLKELNAVISCGLYGEVIYNGTNCEPFRG